LFKQSLPDDKFFSAPFNTKFSNSKLLFFSNFQITKFFFLNFFHLTFKKFNSFLESKFYRNSIFFLSSQTNSFLEISDFTRTSIAPDITPLRPINMLVFSIKLFYPHFKILQVLYGNSISTFFYQR
jgi:hypothetical protein